MQFGKAKSEILSQRQAFLREYENIFIIFATKAEETAINVVSEIFESVQEISTEIYNCATATNENS